MRMIKNIVVHALLGVLIGLLVCTFLIMSPLLMAMYILDWSVKFEDDMMTDNIVYDNPPLYVSEKGIEWDAVRP